MDHPEHFDSTRQLGDWAATVPADSELHKVIRQSPQKVFTVSLDSLLWYRNFDAAILDINVLLSTRRLEARERDELRALRGAIAHRGELMAYSEWAEYGIIGYQEGMRRATALLIRYRAICREV